MDETLTGRTTRAVTFTDESTSPVVLPVRKSAGTLLEQDVPLSAVEPE